ncbi:MAG: hypothetical protein Q4C61_01660 [Lachnospiraceae bacterium]|nr:hypothetical protein [Lachnospiraceae bacterium]
MRTFLLLWITQSFSGLGIMRRMWRSFMAAQEENSILIRLFGAGKGSGAAFLFLILAFAGIGVCVYFRHNRDIWELEKRLSK